MQSPVRPYPLTSSRVSGSPGPLTAANVYTFPSSPPRSAAGSTKRVHTPQIHGRIPPPTPQTILPTPTCKTCGVSPSRTGNRTQRHASCSAENRAARHAPLVSASPPPAPRGSPCPPAARPRAGLQKEGTGAKPAPGRPPPPSLDRWPKLDCHRAACVGAKIAPPPCARRLRSRLPAAGKTHSQSKPANQNQTGERLFRASVF
jgi:hypothetical protein